MRNKKDVFKIKDYYNLHRVSMEIINSALVEIKKYLPEYKGDRCATLKELDEFMSVKYKAQRADWKDIDKCTKTDVRLYNEYCHTVFGISEGFVTDRDYATSYFIERKHCINPSTHKDDFFYDMFLIIGSKDGEHCTSYYVGGHSDGFLREMCVLSGQYLKERK